jgi:hypothetical protein
MGAALEWTAEGTSDGDTVSYDGVSILEIEDGKVRHFMAYKLRHLQSGAERPHGEAGLRTGRHRRSRQCGRPEPERYRSWYGGEGRKACTAGSGERGVGCYPSRQRPDG